MFGFLRLLHMFCVSVAVAIVYLFFSPFFVFCPVYVLTGVLNVWISASSGLVSCVGGHSHHKSVIFLRFFFLLCAHRFLKCSDLFCVSVAMATENLFFPPVCFCRV